MTRRAKLLMGLAITGLMIAALVVIAAVILPNAVLSKGGIPNYNRIFAIVDASSAAHAVLGNHIESLGGSIGVYPAANDPHASSQIFSQFLKGDKGSGKLYARIDFHGHRSSVMMVVLTSSDGHKYDLTPRGH